MILFRVVLLIAVSAMLVLIVKSDTFAVEIDAVLDQCCDFGSNLASSSKSCGYYAFTIVKEISPHLHKLCRANLELCCEKETQRINCKRGKSYSQQGNCYDNDRSQMFQVCCNACKVGREIAQTSRNCNQRTTWDSMVDKVTIDCCTDFDDEILKEEVYGVGDSIDDYDSNEGSADSPENDRTACERGHQCEHECYLQGGNAFCDCNGGYVLDQNGYSCNKIASTDTKKDDCESGLQKNSFGDCVDIDECKSSHFVCSPLERCINTQGSFKCESFQECPNGHEFNRDTWKCEDIDECARENLCLITDNCVNTPGFYRCVPKTCPSGYQLNHDTGECDDTNECLRKVCGQNSECVNRNGSYSCICAYGYREEPGYPHICRDIDECQEHPMLCDHSCHNTWGSYQCSCRQGFRLKSDNRTCTDVDECEKNGKLLCPGSCKNTWGSYRCGCPEGLKIEGKRVCTDINECREISGLCRGKDEFCLNTYGSYECMERRCENGYRYKRGECHLMDRTKCFDSSVEVTGYCGVPQSYGFTFGTVMANCTVQTGGRGLYYFNLDSKYDFDIELKDFKVTDAGLFVHKAMRNLFHFKKSRGSFTILLLRPLDGPQKIVLDLWIHLNDNRTSHRVIRGQKVSVVVSKY